MSRPSPGGRDVRSLLAAAWRAGRGRAVRAFLLALAAGAAEGAGLALLLPLLALVGIGASPAAGPLASLPLVLALFAALVAAEALLERAHAVASARLSSGLARDLRRRLDAALAGSSWTWFSRRSAAETAHAMTEETDRAAAAAQALLTASVQGVLALVYLGLALSVAPALAGVAAALVLLAWLRMGRAHRLGAEESRAGAALHAAVGEGMQEARTDRAHGLSVDASARVDRAAGDAARGRVSTLRHLATSRALAATGIAAALALVVWVSVALLGTGPAALLVSLLLLNRLFHRASAFALQVEYAAADLPGYRSVERLTRAALAAAEPRDAEPPAPMGSGLVLENVTFGYAGPDRPAAVDGVSLSIPAGSLVVVEGRSGSGKTTLLDLAAGVLRPDGGRLLADGRPLAPGRTVSVGYAAQDPLLVPGTVRANLLRARPGASEAEVRAALGAAGGPAPDREAGERGQALSGGERRRVALARALLREPDLLVLDGVADGLGPDEERDLLDRIEALRGRAAVLLVARGEEARRRADRVLRMEGGRALDVATEAVP